MYVRTIERCDGASGNSQPENSSTLITAAQIHQYKRPATKLSIDLDRNDDDDDVDCTDINLNIIIGCYELTISLTNS